MTHKLMKRCSKRIVIREKQVKTTIRNHFVATRTAIRKKPDKQQVLVTM